MCSGKFQENYQEEKKKKKCCEEWRLEEDFLQKARLPLHLLSFLSLFDRDTRYQRL